jgi:hypothetical protein
VALRPTKLHVSSARADARRSKIASNYCNSSFSLSGE